MVLSSVLEEMLRQTTTTRMTEEPSGACETIDSMIKELNCQYARAERMMSLRSSNPDNLTQTCIAIDQLFSQLIDTVQLSGVAKSLADSVRENVNSIIVSKNGFRNQI